MPSILESSLRVLARNQTAWSAFTKICGSNDGLDAIKRSVEAKQAKRECFRVFAANEVLAGPFAGMRYANPASVGSSLWPKFAGTYEAELHPILSTILKRSYKRLIDVGYAEGFYLVGLGRLLGKATLVGFDIDTKAPTLCAANAALNSIDKHRLCLFGGWEELRFRDELTDDSLVILDCEGVENNVVSALDQTQLRSADWLIETHDHLVPSTSARLSQRFSETHDVTIVDTQPEEQKLAIVPDQLRTSCDENLLKFIVSERRKAPQTWIFAQRKNA